ncbi:hypothetical protein Tco_0566926 [Tanacetum coccineum]
MPLSDKTILDSHCFVHELKKEMHDDLEYVKSLEKEIDELESEKADFSNMYDLLLESIPTGHRFSNKKTTTVPEKTMNPRSCLRWKPTGRIFSNVRLRWIPTGKLFNSCTGKVESEPTHVSIVDMPSESSNNQTLGFKCSNVIQMVKKQQRIDLNADALYNEKQENLRVWLLKFLISKKPVPECSSLGRQCQMVSAENNTSGPNSEFKTTAMNSQFKAGSKSCSLSKQDSYITTRIGITIPPSNSNAEDNSHKVVRLGINPMIQPEPEDLPKDNPKLEIAVLRMKKKCMDKGCKERSPPHNLRQKPGQYICCQNHKLIADIENDIMDPVMQCTTLLSHSGFSQQKLVSFVTEIHTLSIDISLRDC